MPPAPRTSALISSEMSTLAGARSAICTHLPFATKTHEGRTMSHLKITSGAGVKPAVIIVAGIHAREWAPPDATLSFAQMLCNAYAGGTSINYPAFTDPDTSISYAAFTIAAADVKAAVERLVIYLLPVANPDGRDFSLSAAAHNMWRKNRSPNPSSGGCIGTDLNRNFPMAWDFELYYKSAVSSTAGMQRLKDPCDPGIFRGRAPASEIETTNIKNLIDMKDPAFFIDVHSHGRKLMFSWATETNQSATPTQNFTNANWDRTGPMGGRDGTSGALYGEFFPNAAPDRLLDDHVAIGNAMRDAILSAAGADAVARTESTYTVTNSTGIGYMSPGSIDDYAFARQFNVAGARSTRSFCMECGSDTNSEGGFHPDYVKKFPKIEREIHAALHALLKEGVRRAPAAPPKVAPPSEICFIATAVYGSQSHPVVMGLRTQRDLLQGLPGWRGAAARSAISVYYRMSPPVARFLLSRPVAARLVRRFVVGPLARLLEHLNKTAGFDRR